MTNTAPTVEEFYRGMGRMVVRFFGRTPGAASVVAPHAILACSGLDSVFLNCGVVFGDGRGADAAEARFREFVLRIRELGVGGYVCLSEPVQRRLEPLARDVGLEPLPPIPLMAHVAPPARGVASGRQARASGRPPLDPGAFTIERVAGAGGLADFLAVSEAAFDLPAGLYARVVTPGLLAEPGLVVYLCRLEDSPVSCVCVVVEDGLAGISGMATLPELQGRGIGSMLLAHVVEAHRRDVRAFYLTATEDGRALYERHGFATVDASTAWVVPPARA